MKEPDLDGVIRLMQTQSEYIHQAHQMILGLYEELSPAANASLQKFLHHFQIFAIKHAGSEGFGRALSRAAPNYVLLEQLLEEDIMTAAEELELAILHLETAMTDPLLRSSLQLILLSRFILLLEEEELNIIQTTEQVLKKSRYPQLRN